MVWKGEITWGDPEMQKEWTGVGLKWMEMDRGWIEIYRNLLG